MENSAIIDIGNIHIAMIVAQHPRKDVCIFRPDSGVEQGRGADVIRGIHVDPMVHQREEPLVVKARR